MHSNLIKLGISNQVQILPEATTDSLINFAFLADHSVVLCDIEGGEFDLLENNLLQAFAKAFFIIEIHDWNGRQDSYENLRNRASSYFDIEELSMSSRDLSLFPELSSYDDYDRWLMCCVW